MAKAEAWLAIANQLGYISEEAMLQDLYLKQEFSLADLKSILGYSPFAIRSRLMRLGIPLRSRGGANNHLGHRRLKHLTDEELKHRAVDIAKKHQVHLATVYAEIKHRKKELRDAVCADHANQSL